LPDILHEDLEQRQNDEGRQVPGEDRAAAVTVRQVAEKQSADEHADQGAGGDQALAERRKTQILFGKRQARPDNAKDITVQDRPTQYCCRSLG